MPVDKQTVWVIHENGIEENVSVETDHIVRQECLETLIGNTDNKLPLHITTEQHSINHSASLLKDQCSKASSKNIENDCANVKLGNENIGRRYQSV